MKRQLESLVWQRHDGNVKRMWEKGELVIAVALISLVSLMGILSQQQSAIAQSVKNTAEPPIKGIQATEPPKISPKPVPVIKKPLPRISFEKTVCDLGDVGQGTKNTCEFKFTNTGSADGGLKIGKINQIYRPERSGGPEQPVVSLPCLP